MKLPGTAIAAIERGLIPDSLTRIAIRRLCCIRLEQTLKDCDGDPDQCVSQLAGQMKTAPVALLPEKANEQHYELPPEFFELVLGTHRKYSCCYWPSGTASLDEAENASLAATCRHAQLDNGQRILELGCGWGSLSLWMAKNYPQSQITAVSNSAPQRLSIESAARARGLENLSVITADMNSFSPPNDLLTAGGFDRIVSVEMFEHMRNYERLLERIAGWLKPAGKLLVHIFCHRNLAYPFETQGEANWMGRYFFTGGIMPSQNLLSHFSRDLRIQEQWTWNGCHYQRTADAWLARLDANRRQLLPILNDVYGHAEARRWLNRWRMFFLAVSELFGYREGTEWFVSHYLLHC